MKKDKTTSIRINSEILAILNTYNITPQMLIDRAISEYVQIKQKIEYCPILLSLQEEILKGFSLRDTPDVEKLINKIKEHKESCDICK